ncbi:hypothetical protein EON65_28725 [archaeon]|nr:MAG: hypothetical protein EON65_28725 [archaeon]
MLSRPGRTLIISSLLLRRAHLSPLAVISQFHSSVPRLNDIILKSSVTSPELNSDLTKLSLPVFLLKDYLTKDKKDLEAIVDGNTGASLTYGDIFYSATSFSDSLSSKMGVDKGDRVAIISPNHLHFFTAFLGISLSQAVSTCMNPVLSADEVFYQLEKTQAKLVIAHPMCLETVLKVVPKERVIVMDDGVNDTKDYGMTKLSSLMSTAPNKAAESKLAIPKDFDPFSLVTVPFSSGTTGRSKGVMLTHHNLVSNVLQTMPFEGQYLKAADGRPRGTLLCPLPFFHIYGLVAGILVCSYASAKLIFMPSFDLKKYLELIQQHKVTRCFVVPPIVLALAKHPLVDQYDLSSVNCFMSGAAPLGPELQVAAAKRLNTLVKQAWGMTETSPCGTITPDDQVITLCLSPSSNSIMSRMILIFVCVFRLLLWEVWRDFKVHQAS